MVAAFPAFWPAWSRSTHECLTGLVDLLGIAGHQRPGAHIDADVAGQELPGESRCQDLVKRLLAGPGNRGNQRLVGTEGHEPSPLDRSTRLAAGGLVSVVAPFLVLELGVLAALSSTLSTPG